MKNYNETWQDKKVKLYCYGGGAERILANIALILLLLINVGIIILVFSSFYKPIKIWMIALSVIIPLLINYIIRRILFYRSVGAKFFSESLELGVNKKTYIINRGEVSGCKHNNLLGGRLSLSIVYSGKTVTLREPFRKKEGGALLFDISEFLIN